jgi:hypothetical protein
MHTGVWARSCGLGRCGTAFPPLGLRWLACAKCTMHTARNARCTARCSIRHAPPHPPAGASTRPKAYARMHPRAAQAACTRRAHHEAQWPGGPGLPGPNRPCWVMRNRGQKWMPVRPRLAACCMLTACCSLAACHATSSMLHAAYCSLAAWHAARGMLIPSRCLPMLSRSSFALPARNSLLATACSQQDTLPHC